MIRINLLPEEMRGRGRRTGAPRGEGLSPLIVLLVVLFLLVDVGAYWFILHSVEVAKQRTRELSAELDAKTRERDRLMPNYEEMIALRDQLKVKEAILKTLDPPDRILWSQKLNMLCYIVHPQVFLTNLQLKEAVKEEETKESIKRRQDFQKLAKPTGKPPAPEMVPIITQTLTITGITTGKTNLERYDNFRKFWDDLQHFQTTNNRGEAVHFMDGFIDTTLGEGGLDFTKKVGGKEVGQFTVTLTTFPMSGEAS